MQSFAYQVKSELCRVPVQRICCARAEAYGVLLYCNTFNARALRIREAAAEGRSPEMRIVPYVRKDREFSGRSSGKRERPTEVFAG